MFNLRTYTNVAHKSLNLYFRITTTQNGIHHQGITSTYNNNNNNNNIKEVKNNAEFPSQDAASSDNNKKAKIRKESEYQFLVRAKLNPDQFGTPTSSSIITETCVEQDDEEGDLIEEKHLTEKPHRSQKLTIKQYADRIKSFIRQRKIKEAIDVLEMRMLKEDRVKPNEYIYNLLLGACGRVGYTKKAFMLYNDMKKRGFEAEAGTYTALFNACANSPWPETDGLKRAEHLLETIQEKHAQLNDTHYNAMIKAFGRCGDISKAFSLVDEMEVKKFPLKIDTLNFLFQSCISAKEIGFRHCLLIWRKMLQKQIKPNIYTFNLILRCVRDCRLGDLDVTKDVLKTIVGNNAEEEFIEEEKNLSDIAVNNNQSILDQIRPNLLAITPQLGTCLTISEVKKPEDRLLLIGGCKGFLEIMEHFKCTPDIKTFTLLLDNIPSAVANEKELLNYLQKFHVQPDIDFYNMLMKKMSLRLDYKGAKEILMMMKKSKMRPDLITYGILALGCKTKDEALNLIQEMKYMKYRINAEILGTLQHAACYQMDFPYIFEIMELVLKESVAVNKKYMEHLQNFKKQCRYLRDSQLMSKKQVQNFVVFNERYKNWLTEVQIDETEDLHPWQQFRQENRTENVKSGFKDAARFKARHLSLFKVKTSQKLRKKSF